MKSLFRPLFSLYHYIWALLGAWVYRYPSRDIFVLGITGTKGKSTVGELVSAIFEAAGKKTALLSSVRTKIDGESHLNKTGMTMPGRFAIQRFLRRAVDGNCDYAIIEVTSQGVLQHRHRWIDFNAAMLTNLQPEHLEAHGSFANYRDSKLSFFSYVAHSSRKSAKIFFVNNQTRDYQYFTRVAESDGTLTVFNRKDLAKLKLKPKIIGEFNEENIAAAIAFARSQNIEWETIKHALEAFDGVPGRFEFIQQQPFAVIIDYAHTPDSLESVYQTVKQYLLKTKKQKLICVLGAAGGGRDVWKRPVMGKIAARYCDEIVLTNEDPFDEEPVAIVDQIEGGMIGDHKPPVERYMDRKEAIRKAIQKAKRGDVVMITGKGSEPYMRVAHNRKIPWNERELVLKILNSERIEL